MILDSARALVRRPALALVAGALYASVPLAAQSPDWSGILTISPTPSPYLTDWERVPSTALLSLTYTGTGATDFRVRVTLTSATRGLIGTTESPTVTIAGGPTSYLYSVRDAVFEWTTVSRNAAVTDVALKTGQIPEGDYRACARVLIGVAGTLATEACAEFSILQPDPPQLLMPQDGGLVVSTQPFFQWTPVLAPPTVPLSYEITVVELLDGKQQPRAALESNIPVLRAVSSTPFLIYPIDALPLERTKRYAWQVRAVDDAGRQLFRDGASSEIWAFEMSDELLRPVGKVDDLPDSLVLLPGVAQLTGLRNAKIQRTDTDITIDGPVTLQFLGAAAAKEQEVQANGLRAGFRGDQLTLLSGTLEAQVPESMIPEAIRGLVTFAPLTFSPATGFRATAALKIPGAAPVPLVGAVQLTAAGLYGRLEGSRAGNLPIRTIGRAPVQYAPTTARLTLPDGRLEFTGPVLVFEQDIGCPATGAIENGIARMPVFCDPARGFRPDTSSARSLLTFGTLAGSLAADFLTDTLGSDLRGPATFSVFGERDRSCRLEFTMVFVRDAIRREDEQQSCDAGEAAVDFGWVRMSLSNLRIERLEYAPGATLVWRAVVDLEPEVRGARDLNLPTLRDVRLDELGVHLPSTGSEQPGTSTSGYVELAGFGVVPRTIGFRGGLISYRRWLNGDDPGFEWGSGTSWIRLPLIGPANSNCLNTMPFEVDTLILARGRLEAPLQEKRFDGDGCKLYAAENLHVMITSVHGAVRLALDSVAHITELPAVTAAATDHRPDCGIIIIGCLGGPPRELMAGDIRLTPRGRLLGTATDFKASWATFDLRFAKLHLAGGTFVMGVDTSGAQTALYDGSVKVDFGKIDETKKADTTATKDTSAVGSATSTATGLGGGLLSGAGDTVRALAKLDWVRSRFIGGSIALKGPFKLEVGFVKFIVGEATLDTLGLHVDGRQRTLVAHTTATAKTPASGTTKVDSTYATKDDTVGVTFAGVRLDPSTGDIGAGTVTFDGQLALESSPLSGAFSVAVAAVGGAIDSGGTGSLARTGSAVTSTNVFGFKLVDAGGAFDPTTLGGNIRLNLPSTPTMDAQGMRISGVAPATAAFAGSRYDSASVSFENGFAMAPAAARVTAGRALFKVRQYPIAFLEPAGWRLAIAELVQTLIPDTLFLPDRNAAYIVLRDTARQLLVDVNETNEGPRIRTRTGTPVKLVIPALKGARQSPPAATIAMDLTLERGTWRPLAGEVVAAAAGLVADDFANPDFPLQVDSVIFRATREAPPRFLAHGRLNAWPQDAEPMQLAIGIAGDGQLTASATMAFRDDLPLVNGSPLVKFHLDSLRFTAQGKLGADFRWRVETPGRLTYFDTERQRESQLATATFRLSPEEAALLDFHALDSLTTVRLPGVDLRLGRVRAPTFRWDMAARRFDFELLFDVGLMVPALDSLALPEIRDIRITPQGMVIPSFEMGSTPVGNDPSNPFAPVLEVRVGGFGVKALAFRVSEFRWDWFAGAPPPSFDFGVDLEFAVEDLPSALEGQSARIALRALDVGVTNGVVTGHFEPIEIPVPIRTPVADIRGAFGAFRVAPDVAPDISIGVIADLRLPDLLACPDAASRYVAMTPGADTLFLASNGTIRGSMRNVLPRCPMDLGPFDLTFGQSTVTFGYDATRQRVDVALDLAATLRVPGDTPNETVSATGRLVIDVDEARVQDASITIDQPFFWAPDSANPFLKLIVSEASLTASELRFGATGQLRTNEGAGVDVAFEEVAFDLNTLVLKSGRIRLTADAAVGIEIPDDGSLLFGVYPVTTPRGGTASARLVLPQGALIDSAGLHINGTATASLAFGGNEYATLAGEFANGFTISTAGRVAIARGRVNLRDGGGQLIAYADSLGFWPGNVFAVLPIPARLGLPTTDVGWIQLRDPADTAQLLVETEFSAETVRLRTRPNQRVTVGLPALARGGPVPEIQAEFDIVLNARTMRPISGGLLLEAATGQSLIPLEGLPVSITRLGFAADTGGFRLRAAARAKLPGPLAEVTLDFRNLEVTAQGLTGVIELGDYSEVYDPQATPIAQANILGDTLAIAFTGAELTLQPNANVVRISGGIRSSLFKLPSGAPRVIHLAATIDSSGFRGTADVSDAETPIPIGVAELRLENGANKPALAVTATSQEFAVVLGGSIRLPSVAPGFSLGVEDFKVGSAGIAIPSISVTAPANTKEFELFGARFALRDSTVGSTQVAPAIGIAYDRGVVRFTLSGYVTLLENTTRFIGLRFATDGQFSLQGADFLSRPIDLIAGTARLTRATIVNNGLELRGDVKLPAPFTQQAAQEIMVRINADGTVTGGGRIVVIAEAEGLATAQTKLSVGVAAFHLRRLDVELDFSSLANTAVGIVADVYIQEKQENLLRFGRVEGNTVTPGLRISAAGQVTWGGLSMPGPIKLTMGPIELTLREVTATSTPTGGFAVDISGALGLNLSGSGGSLTFQHVGFTSEGEVRLGSARIDGGTLTIQDKVKIVVGRFAFSDSDTSIYVPVARPPAANGDIQRDSALTAVSMFVDFGASVDIAGVFSGGVDRVLVYVKSVDSTNHFLIENLAVNISGVIEFRASMSYDEFPDGFEMALSTEGVLMSAYRIGLVGVMGQRAGVFRAGVFLRTSLTVPIVPGIVTLTEVGGGLFINPYPSDLLLVKSVAGMNGPSADRIGMPPASKFAVMLYAGFAVGGVNGASVAAGRALVTITDQAFQINAMATFFQMNDQVSGDLALQVGWVPAPYVRGMVALVIDIDSTVAGTASVEFFAGNNVFAVKGDVDMLILGVIQSYAQVIIVPSGFTANLGFRIQKTASVVAVDVGANLRIWYRPSTNDLGAYLRLYGNVTVIGITGQIELIGALVIQPELAIYAQGTAQIVGIDQLRVDVWVQYTSAGFSAGTGRNEELAAVLARAEQIAADLTAEANRILAGIDADAQERARTPLGVSEQSLAAAYDNFQRWSAGERLLFWGTFVAGEGTYGMGFMPLTAVDPWVSFYNRVLNERSTGADTALVKQLRTEAQGKLQVIADRRAEVETRIRALRLELDVAEQAVAFAPPVNPVTDTASGSPSIVEGPMGADGKPTMIVANPPRFELDDQLAAQARATMTAAARASAAAAPSLRAQLARVETGLSTVMAATTASDPNSFASYARVHSDAVEAIEHQFAADVDFRMRRRGWAQGKLDTISTGRAGVVQQLNDRIDAIVDAETANTSVAERTRRLRIVYHLDTIARHRATLLTAWSGDQSILSSYQAAATTHMANVNARVTALRNDPNDTDASSYLDLEIVWFRTQAVDYGIQAWWGVGNTGVSAAVAGASGLVASADAAARPVVRAMRDMHANITTQLGALNERQRDLVGALYDLYDGYLRTYGAADSIGQAYTARRTQLGALLAAPRMGTSQVIVTDFGFLSSVQSTWNGTHANGIYEYLMQEGADSLMTVGAQGTARRWQYTTDLNGASVPMNQRLQVRGGAGFTAQSLTSYTVTFRRGSAGSPVTQVAVPPTDVTAPSGPVVEFPGLISRVSATGATEYWTGAADRLAVSWSANDPESGISEYLYRVISYVETTTSTLSLGGTYTLAIPRRTGTVEHLPWTSAGGRTSVTVTGLTLPSDRPIVVEVRARNGAGILGGARSSPILRNDVTAPVFPTGTVLAPPPVTTSAFTVFSGMTLSTRTLSISGYTPPLAATCGLAFGFKGTAGTKVWDGTLVTVTADNGVVGAGSASLAFNFPLASDPETGVYAYGYRVDTVAPSGTLPTTGWYDLPAYAPTFNAQGPAMVFGRPLWISFAAWNGGGGRSAPLTYGPVTVPDPTGPSAPVHCGDYSAGGFIAYLTALASDTESGVRGYQMRVRGPTGAILRDFPAGTTVDWPASQAQVGRGIRIPVGVSTGGNHRVELRALNGAGVAGAVTISGEVLVDLTAASVPGVSALRGLNNTIGLNLSITNDLESGIAGVDIAFASGTGDPLSAKSGSVLLVPYTSYPAIAGTNKLQVTVPAAVYAQQPLYVFVRVRNGAGLSSVAGITAVH